MKTPARVRLDPAHPFVSAVRGVMRGEAHALDVAAEVLRQAELETGLMVLPGAYAGQPGPDGLSDELEGSIQRLLDRAPIVVDGELMQNRLAMCDRQNRDVGFSFREWGHHVATWLARGGQYEEVDADRGGKLCGCDACRALPRRGLFYIDFYMRSYTAPIFADYDAWCTAALEVVDHKRRRYGFRWPE